MMTAPAPAAWLSRLRTQSGGVAASLAVSLLLVVLIAVADYITGYEIRLGILYLVPIAWTTWRVGPWAGSAVAVVAEVFWLVTFEDTHFYSHTGYFYLEGLLTGATYLIIVVLLAGLRRALVRSDARLLTVLEGLDAAVHVEDVRTGAALYENQHYSRVFGRSRRFSQESGEIYDGETHSWYLLQSRPLRWTDGREAVLRMFSDITEERAAREMAAKQREESHRTSRLVALGEFASGIAHEINQPLTAIATYNDACLRLLDAGAHDPAELRAAMQKCRDQAHRAAAIIQRLREILRQPTGVQARLDLREVADTVRQLAEPDAAEAGVQIEVASAERLPRVRTDRLLVEQVALNLVRNAIEAVRELPLERRRVTISTGLDAQGVALSVADLGEGVPASLRERVFEAFVTTKPGGLGLGLSICRSVVESLGGTIRHEGNGPLGARFSFALPAADQ